VSYADVPGDSEISIIEQSVSKYLDANEETIMLLLDEKG